MSDVIRGSGWVYCPELACQEFSESTRSARSARCRKIPRHPSHWATGIPARWWVCIGCWQDGQVIGSTRATVPSRGGEFDRTRRPLATHTGPCPPATTGRRRTSTPPGRWRWRTGAAPRTRPTAGSRTPWRPSGGRSSSASATSRPTSGPPATASRCWCTTRPCSGWPGTPRPWPTSASAQLRELPRRWPGAGAVAGRAAGGASRTPGSTSTSRATTRSRRRVAAVRAAGAEDRVCLASFSDRRIRRVRRAGRTSRSPPRAAPGRSPCCCSPRCGGCGRPAGGGAPAASRCPVRSRGVRVVSARFVARAHELGLQVHVWTVDDEVSIRALLDLGVDGLITDRIDVLRDVLDRDRRRAGAATSRDARAAGVVVVRLGQLRVRHDRRRGPVRAVPDQRRRGRACVRRHVDDPATATCTCWAARSRRARWSST